MGFGVWGLGFDVSAFALHRAHVPAASGACVTLPVQWHTLVAADVQRCSGVGDAFLLQLLSRAHALRSLSVVGCDAVTCGGFASVACTQLQQLEIVACANVQPDDVMAASARVMAACLAALNLSRGSLGALQLHHMRFITTLLLDRCYGVTQDAAAAVVSCCRELRVLSAAGVAAFGACDVLLRLHELPLVCARLTCGGDHDTWVCVASFALCARALHTLVIVACDGEGDEDAGEGEGLLEEGEVGGGAGAEECARAVQACLRMRGGGLQMMVWSEERDGWRL